MNKQYEKPNAEIVSLELEETIATDPDMGGSTGYPELD